MPFLLRLRQRFSQCLGNRSFLSQVFKHFFVAYCNTYPLCVEHFGLRPTARPYRPPPPIFSLFFGIFFFTFALVLKIFTIVHQNFNKKFQKISFFSTHFISLGLGCRGKLKLYSSTSCIISGINHDHSRSNASRYLMSIAKVQTISHFKLRLWIEPSLYLCMINVNIY
jgi:hypothetical protein